MPERWWGSDSDPMHNEVRLIMIPMHYRQCQNYYHMSCIEKLQKDKRIFTLTFMSETLEKKAIVCTVHSKGREEASLIADLNEMYKGQRYSFSVFKPP